MEEFYSNGVIPKGCNSSFISLIPKVDSPSSVKEYRLISLIRLQYKILSKLLANRLTNVIGSIVSPTQYAFVKGRQILDGSFMVNEIIDWCKKKKNKAMIFKVEFDKAYDSVSWEYLVKIMEFMDFDHKWIRWIHACLESSRDAILVNGSPTKELSLNRGLW